MKQATLLSHMKFLLLMPLPMGSIFFGLLVLGLGLFIENSVLIVVASLITLWYPVLAFLGYGTTSDFEIMIRSFALGDWREAQKILNRFHNYNNNALPLGITLVLDTMGAKLLAIASSPKESLAVVKKNYGFIEKLSLRDYIFILMNVHYINGDYQECIKVLEKLTEEYPNDAACSLDLAHYQARYGDIGVAKKIFNAIVAEELPHYALPAYYQVKPLSPKRMT